MVMKLLVILFARSGDGVVKWCQRPYQTYKWLFLTNGATRTGNPQTKLHKGAVGDTDFEVHVGDNILDTIKLPAKTIIGQAKRCWQNF